MEFYVFFCLKITSEVAVSDTWDRLEFLCDIKVTTYIEGTAGATLLLIRE